MEQHTGVLARHIELNGRDVVDVGCGQGRLVRWMRREGARVVGVECGEILRARAVEADPAHAGDYVDGVAQDLPLATESADLLVFSYSFHHVPIEAMPEALSEARRVLRGGGRLYVLEPNPAGVGAESLRLVDDETTAQLAAQNHLDAAAVAGLEETVGEEYLSETSYDDFDSWAQLMMDVDPDRAERFQATRAETERRFRANSTVRDGRFVFTKSNILRIFTAV